MTTKGDMTVPTLKTLINKLEAAETDAEKWKAAYELGEAMGEAGGLGAVRDGESIYIQVDGYISTYRIDELPDASTIEVAP